MKFITTLSFGDIVPVHPIARTFAALEAAAGILYIAITVARFVSGYHAPLSNSCQEHLKS